MNESCTWCYLDWVKRNFTACWKELQILCSTHYVFCIGQKNIYAHNYIGFLFLCNALPQILWLKTTRISYLTVMVVQVSGFWLADSPLGISQDCNQDVMRVVFSPGGLTRKEFASMLTQSDGRILPHAVVRPRTLASC